MQSEILRLLDAPLQQGFAAHVIGERFRFLQQQNISAGARQHRRQRRAGDPGSDDDYLMEIFGSGHSPPPQLPGPYHLGVGAHGNVFAARDLPKAALSHDQR